MCGVGGCVSLLRGVWHGLASLGAADEGGGVALYIEGSGDLSDVSMSLCTVNAIGNTVAGECRVACTALCC
jgi:hypothetical protein